MRKILAAAGFALFLLTGQAGAGDQATKEKAAKSKAKALEKKSQVQPHGPPAPPARSITKSEVQAVDPVGKERMDDVITCLARTIYWETKGSGNAPMQAVANVVMNRLGHEGFPNTICGVVKQGREQGACQFSWWCDGRPDSVQEKERYAHAKEIARKALNRQLKDLTGGAMYFHRKGLSPVWSKKYIRTTQVGNHLFYRPAGGKAK